MNHSRAFAAEQLQLQSLVSGRESPPKRQAGPYPDRGVCPGATGLYAAIRPSRQGALGLWGRVRVRRGESGTDTPRMRHVMTDPGHRRGHKTRTARSQQTAEPGVSRGLQNSLPADTLTSDPQPPAARGDVLLSELPVASVMAAPAWPRSRPPPPPWPRSQLPRQVPGKAVNLFRVSILPKPPAVVSELFSHFQPITVTRWPNEKGLNRQKAQPCPLCYVSQPHTHTLWSQVRAGPGRPSHQDTQQLLILEKSL